MYLFNKEKLSDFAYANSRNFALSNGLGGMSSMSIINSTYRKQFGYLVAALNPPLDRFLVLTKTTEKIIYNNQTYDLDSQKYDDKNVKHHNYLNYFKLDYLPTYYYELPFVNIKKKLAPIYLMNAVAITYEINSSVDLNLQIEPLYNFREQGDASSIDSLQFDEKFKDGIFTLTPLSNPNVHIKTIFDGCSLFANNDKYSEAFYNEYDILNGDSRLDYHYKPIYFNVNVSANKTSFVSIMVTLDRVLKKDAFSALILEEERLKKVERAARIKDDFANKLVLSADNFIVERYSTNRKTILAGLPWFADWGRDTMISFTGLTLVTKRYKDARSILESFAIYERNGLIPNMFPNSNEEPLYNTADASLWYIYACYKYAKYTGDYGFIKEKLFNTLKNIIHFYIHGTDNDIYMDKDGLIHAGSDLDQVTWMDVRFDGFVVTPRHGKPVEINALWYNALKIMAEFALLFNENEEIYEELAEKVKKSFRQKFYNKDKKCLFDVVDPNDDKIRPNQLYALSLPFKLYSCDEAKIIMNSLEELYNVYGIRTLSPRDKEYKDKYEGPLRDRDLAYHMGSSWAYLTGAYFDAYNYAYPEKKEELKQMILAFNSHLEEGCIGGIAELFNGSDTKVTKGCYNQAWSVGEVLRSYYENILIEGD